MAFGGEMHHRVRPGFGEDPPHGVGVGDVGPHERVPRVAVGGFQRVQRCGIGHLVDVHDFVSGAV
jgi:hypothetical protein